jgi:hypothetical protein
MPVGGASSISVNTILHPQCVDVSTNWCAKSGARSQTIKPYWQIIVDLGANIR